MLSQNPSPERIIFQNYPTSSAVSIPDLMAVIDDGEWYAAMIPNYEPANSKTVLADQIALSEYISGKDMRLCFVQTDYVPANFPSLQNERTALIVHDKPNDNLHCAWASQKKVHLHYHQFQYQK